MDERLQTAFFSQVLWLGAAVLGGLMVGGALHERLGLIPSRLRWTGVAIAVLGFLALSISSDAVLRILDLRDVGQLRQLDQLAGQQTGRNALATFAILGLFPALAEELLFRGLIQRILVERLGAAVGIVGTAALFGLAHADPVHSSAAFVLGLFLGALAFIAGGIGPAIVCHAFNNVIGVTGAMAQGGLPGPSELGIPGLFACAGLALWLTSRPRFLLPAGKLQANGGDAES